MLIMMLLAVTLPSVSLVPCTAMNAPTLRAEELDEPDIVRKVVDEE